MPKHTHRMHNRRSRRITRTHGQALIQALINEGLRGRNFRKGFATSNHAQILHGQQLLRKWRAMADEDGHYSFAVAL